MSTSGYPGNDQWGSAGPVPGAPGNDPAGATHATAPPYSAGQHPDQFQQGGQFHQGGQFQPGQYQQPYGQPVAGQPDQFGQYPAGPQYGPGPAGQPGYSQPAYGQPPYGAPGNVRPGLATAAAVLAFIFGAGAIIQSMFGIIIGSLFNSVSSPASGLVNSGVSVACDSSLPGYSASDCRQAQDGAAQLGDAAGTIGTFGIVLGIGAGIVAILMIWGGVVLLSGKNAKIVVIACVIYFVLAIALMVATSFGVFYIFGLVLPVLIIAFTLAGATRSWVRAKGGRTF
jgi:hypothetical protein